MREAQSVRSTTCIYENQPYMTDESRQFISPRIQCTDIKILLIHEALCARRTRVTSTVERVDFSLSSPLSFDKYFKILKQINNINIIITLFESQILLAEHECCTNWGDCKSNKSNQIKCWFLRRGENRSSRRKTSRSRVENQQTQSTYDAGSGNRTRDTIQYNTIQYNTIQYNTIQYNTIQYNTIQYNTIQYNTIQYNAMQYNTIQYNTTTFI